MDRREFLISTGGGAAAAALAGSAALAQSSGDTAFAAPTPATQRQTLTYAMPWADTGRGFGDSARRLALRIQEATDGRISCVLSQSRSEAQASHGPAYPADPSIAGEARALAYFAGLPARAGLAVQDHLAWLTIGGGQMLWDDLAADRGVKPLAAGHTGERGLLLSKTPVAALEDLHGKKIAVMGPAVEVARGLGLEPVPMADAASADLVDAGGALAALAADLHRTHPFAMDGGLSAHGQMLALEISLPAWESLHPGDRVRIAHAATAELQASLAETRAHETMVRRVMAASFGVTVSDLPASIEAARDRVAEAVVAHVAAGGPRLSASIRALWPSRLCWVAALSPDPDVRPGALTCRRASREAAARVLRHP